MKTDIDTYIAARSVFVECNIRVKLGPDFASNPIVSEFDWFDPGLLISIATQLLNGHEIEIEK
jgi:hypothetical protein